MRTLKRLEIGQLNGFEKLSSEEQNSFIGGYGGEGNCFYNCMEYCSKKFDDRGDRHNYKDYANGYEKGMGGWEGTGTNDQGKDLGPYYATPNDNNSYDLKQTPYDFLDSQFDVEGSSWLKGSDISNCFGSDRNKKDIVIGTFDIRGVAGYGSDSGTHAVIFTGYDPATREYTYINPDDQGRPHYIKEQWVLGAAKVTGKKTKEEGQDSDM